MSVAVKNSPETAARRPLNALALGSIAGTLYLVGCLVAIFYGVPAFGAQVASWMGAFQLSSVATALIILAMVIAAGALILVGRQLYGQFLAPHPPKGLRAGVFTGVLGFLVIGLVALKIGSWIETSSLVTSEGIGLAMTGAIGLVLWVLGSIGFFSPRFEGLLIRLEEQGWFSGVAYKRSQGVRVRRGTIVAVLVLVGSGIATMLSHKVLETGPVHWGYDLPFAYMVELREVTPAVKAAVIETLEQVGNLSHQRAEYLVEHLPAPVEQYLDKQQAVAIEQALLDAGAKGVAVEHQFLVVLPNVRFTLPFLLAAGFMWLGYRLVNFPPFADFLIATEAELNKVSWTTRKRLIQDTIVVLTTMFLITLFLFVVDVGWYQILSSRWIAVIQQATSPADLKTLDDQIERISRERESALVANDTQKAERLRDQIESLRARREQIQLKVKGEPQDW